MRKVNIKESVKNNVTGIGNFHTQSTETVAKVISCSERINSCTINYINQEGQGEIKYDVPIRLSDPDTLGWYPKKDDLVIIKLDANNPVIISDASHLIYKSKLREKTKTPKNIFSSTINALGGFLI